MIGPETVDLARFNQQSTNSTYLKLFDLKYDGGFINIIFYIISWTIYQARYRLP